MQLRQWWARRVQNPILAQKRSLHGALRPVFFLVILGVALFWGASGAFAQGKPKWVEDELLVGLRPGVSHAQAQGVYKQHGAVFFDEIPQIRVHRIKVPPQALENVQRALSRRPEVQFVEKNFIVPPDFIPNDPSYGSEWHLPKISAPQAWDITQGSANVIIAILDSGIDASHPDLGAKLVAGYNFYDNNTNTSDVYGHGTKVAGSATALSNNLTGVASVSWQTKLMPIRVTDTSGYGYSSTIANGLIWAVDHGARVMNISFGGVATDGAIKSAAQYVRSKGGMVVASAGNCGCLDSTAENPYLISVSATDSSDNKASFSSYGKYVDVAAPGLGIQTTVKGGSYGSVSGTSFSAPITAGVLALMMSVNSGLSPADLETLLEANTDDLGASGYDTYFGFGRVNAYKAVLAATATGSNAPPLDTTSPKASISSPTNGATVSGTVTVSVSASDNVSVSKVELYIDGGMFATDTSSPYSFAWTTNGSGSHNLQAIAYDAAGNAGASSVVGVTVSNVADITPPTVTITSPTSGSTISGRSSKVMVSASDDMQLQRVEVYADGNMIGSASCTATSCNTSFNWNTRKLSSGAHSLTAYAYDSAGNKGNFSESVTYASGGSRGTSTKGNGRNK